MDEYLHYDLISHYYFVIGGIFLSYLVYRILQSLLTENTFMQTKYNYRGHTWRSIQCSKSIPYNVHCLVCSKLMMPTVGLFCECCAMSCCKQCYHLLDKRSKCKLPSWPNQKLFRHHWTNVGGRVPNYEVGGENQVMRFFCCWCHRIKMTTRNLLDNSEECDFQKYQNIIIPPKCVQMERGVVTRIKALPGTDWEPLIVFANKKSGSNRSDEVLSLFRGLLNPIQVVDISCTSPKAVVEWLPHRCRILVAGGDGTVAWVLNAIADAPHLKAPVAILPMGTGNDLSRVLGWGPTCDSQIDAHEIIESVTQAVEQPLDRWKVTITPKKRRLGRAGADRVIFAYNYTSIGVDAQVALDFHRARTQFLYKYASRSLNYMTYLVMGAGRAFDDGGCDGLERRLRVRLDTEDTLPLPPVQALVLLNIPSWGAGVDLWNIGPENVEAQKIDDGKLEVLGISSSLQIARLHCGLAEPYRFAQASNVKIELSGSCAMQVDGEPWMQSAATINVEGAGTCLVLRRNTN